MKQLFTLLMLFSCFSLLAQNANQNNPTYIGTVSYMEYVSPLASRSNDLIPSDNSIKEAKDKRSLSQYIVQGKDPQTQDDYFVRNRNEKEQSVALRAADLVFDAYASGSQPTAVHNSIHRRPAQYPALHSIATGSTAAPDRRPAPWRSRSCRRPPRPPETGAAPA